LSDVEEPAAQSDGEPNNELIIITVFCNSFG
jgi:hypothetical protein